MNHYIALVFHHGGHFEENPKTCYVGGEVDVWDNCDVDYITIPIIADLFKEHGYTSYKSCYWLNPRSELENGLCPLNDDDDCRAIIGAAQHVNEIEFFFVHPVEENTQVIGWVSESESGLAQGDEPETAATKDGAKNGGVVTAQASGGQSSDYGNAEYEGEEEGYSSEEEGYNSEEEKGWLSQEDDSASDTVFKPSDEEHEDDDVAFEVNTQPEEIVRSSVLKKSKGKKSSKAKESDVDVGEAEKEFVGGASHEKDPENTFVENDNYESEELRSIASSSDDEGNKGGRKYSQFNQRAEFGQVTLELGMEFPNLDVFMDACRDYNIYFGRPVAFPKNDSVRCRAKCMNEHCDWHCLCSWSNETNSFQIKTLSADHTCPRQVRNKLANRKWLIRRLVPVIRSQPSLTCPDAHNHVKEVYRGIVADRTLLRAMKDARQLVERSEREQYAKFRDYCLELLRTNPNSSLQLGLERFPPELFPRFDRFYMCFDACKKGFLEGCRPLIGLDGCHLKGYYGSQLLTAVAQDGNNGFFVVAYAIVDKENKETWKWFISKLIEDIGDAKDHGWNFMSDQQKGLLPSITELQPNAHQRFCCMHIWKNFSRQWKGLEFRQNFWMAARCTTMPEFQQVMEKIKQMNAKAWAYLNNIPPSAWTRAAYSTFPKNDTQLNNMCEQFNSKLTKYRSKPIITMAEEIRCYIMRKMNDNKLTMATYKGPICPLPQSRLEKAKLASMLWTPQWVGDLDGNMFEVHCMGVIDRVKVDLSERTCSCRVWDLSGVPCKHAVACLAWSNLKPEDFVHPSLSMAAFRRTYSPFIQPVAGQQYWPTSTAEVMAPPKYGRPAGRPKLKRKKEIDEPTNPFKLKKKYGLTTCSICKQTGHNARSCINQPKESQKKLTPRRRRAQAEVGTSQVNSSPTMQGQPSQSSTLTSTPHV